jgi:hypothetical protein
VFYAFIEDFSTDIHRSSETMKQKNSRANEELRCRKNIWTSAQRFLRRGARESLDSQGKEKTMMVLSRSTRDQLHRLICQIQVLQQFQRLLTTEATLADVSHLLACVEANYSAESPLEDVIQHLVGEHLALQIECHFSTLKISVPSNGSKEHLDRSRSPRGEEYS